MSFIGDILRPRPRPRPTPPSPHQQAMEEERQRQQDLDESIVAFRQAAGEPTIGRAGTLEERLKRSRLTLEARLLAAEKERTAKKEQERIQADALSQRSLVVTQVRQAGAEAETKALEEASRVGFPEGVAIFEAFFDPFVGLSQAEVDTTFTPREKDEMLKLQAATVKDPSQIRAFLKKFRNLDPVRLEQILPDEEDRKRLMSITASPSPNPFWNF